MSSSYNIRGRGQYLVFTLGAGQEVLSRPRSMMFREPEVVMQTVTGSGGKKKLKQGAKQVVSGRSFFSTTFKNNSEEKKKVAFSIYDSLGSIAEVKIIDKEPILCRKYSFLAAYGNLSFDAHTVNTVKSGLWGGNGFFLQKVTGKGICFLHAGGSVHEIKLADGQDLVVESGCVLAYEERVEFTVKEIRGTRNVLIGAQRFFRAFVRGPGRVWLQTMPPERSVKNIARLVKKSKRTEKDSLINLAVDKIL